MRRMLSKYIVCWYENAIMKPIFKKLEIKEKVIEGGR
jgi:hypothetical protein